MHGTWRILVVYVSISAMLWMNQHARGDVIHCSATLGPTGQSGGWGINSDFFMGSRFYVDRTVNVTSIGGHLVEWQGGAFFGAIVSLSNMYDLPNGFPFLGAEVVASTVFDPGYPSSDFRTPLSVTLWPGSYALIFGSGEFGAFNGVGAMPYSGQTDIGGASYILWNGSGWWESASGQARFVVEGMYEGYCGASGSNSGVYDHISGVSIGSINNQGTGNSKYADYTSISTDVAPGTSYPLVVSIGNADEYSQCGAWVDWNQDTDFYDAGEQLTMSAVSGGICTATVTVPVDAVEGDTRLRIRLCGTLQGLPQPCGHDMYGEVEDYTFTVLPPGPNTRIYGKKWHDLNDNGELDVGEPGLGGWTIFLDENRNGEIDPNDVVTTTDINGNYELKGMEPDVYYHVSEADKAGWINTYPGAGGIHYRIWVEEANDVELNFGNYQLHNGDINGYKFHDLNNNGVRDAGEGPLSGWEIYIDENENGKWDGGEPKTTTNASGYYEFRNRQPGYYNVMEVQKAGWLQTYPGSTSGRLWGLEGRGSEPSTIAELNLDTMTIENRFAAPFNSTIIGGGCLAAGPGTLFYCPLEFTAFQTANSLFFEIDSETGVVIDQGVLEMPVNEVAWDCAWHNGILYVMSVVVPLPTQGLPVTYLNRYDAFTKELISRDLLIDIGCDGLAGDPYEDLLLCNLFVTWSLYEIDPHTANVVGTVGQKLIVAAEMAYTNGVLYKLFWGRDDIHAIHREDGSLISSQKMTDYEGFDTI
ncbi:MAG: SdrD B-like domain-containing protein, partial [Planctomycetota bacterium]